MGLVELVLVLLELAHREYGCQLQWDSVLMLVLVGVSLKPLVVEEEGHLMQGP